MAESRNHRAVLACLASLLLVVAFAGGAGSASAAAGWSITAQTNTTVAPGGTTTYRVQIVNASTATAKGAVEPISFVATLPNGLRATGFTPLEMAGVKAHWNCAATVFPTRNVKCTDSQDVFSPGRPFEIFEMPVEGAASLPSGAIKTSSLEVSGGAIGAAQTVVPVTIQGTVPEFGLAALDGLTSESAGGSPTVRAAAHPYDSSVSFELNTERSPLPINGDLWPVEPLKDVFAELPPGLVGSPNALATCTIDLLAFPPGEFGGPLCDERSQVGVATVRLNGMNSLRDSYGPIPVYNMVPPPGVPARFGFNVQGTVILLDARVRMSDYGITLVTSNTSEGVPVAGTTVTLWGNPASAAHTPERSCPGKEAVAFGAPACPGASEESAFLRNPTSCQGPRALSTTLQVDSWANPGALTGEGEPQPGDPAWKSTSFLQHEAPGFPHPPAEWGKAVEMGHCSEVPFEPTITVRPTTNRADSPTGLDVDLTMPQSCWQAGQAGSTCQADVKDTSVTQPVGMRVNPATADGLTGCSEAQIGFIGGGFPLPNPTHFTDAQPTCPDSSKIGTVEIESPLIPGTLEGSIYQAKQGENPFGSTLAFYAVAYAEGVMIKLPAEVRTDPDTGQVTTIFRDSPQLPFDHYKLHFFGGSRAPLITPPTCGTHTTQSTYTGWANPETTVHTEDSFQITEGANGTPCPAGEAGRPFKPSFAAGTENPLAGTFSPFVLKLGREDGMQEFTSLETTLPPGLIGRLAGIPYCSDAALAAAEHSSAAAEIATPSCPAASKVGVADAAAGAGPLPYHNPGIAYLAGPYKGAPLSLAIITPALAGPLDLGTVVVRAALRVDPVTTQITAVSDPLPLRLLQGGDGFPLDLRQITVQMNRPNFTLNPTSCDPMAITGTAGGTNGATAKVSSRFQVGGCERLAFKPKLSINLNGATKRLGHPALRAVLRMPAGGANIARAQVNLPHGEFLDQGNLNKTCTKPVLLAGACPATTVYGHAKAWTPLLEKPLEGNVYLVGGYGFKLPALVAELQGQIRVLLVGKVDSGKNKGIRNTFELVPDAPVEKFELSMKGGPKYGLLENSEDLCRKPQRAIVAFSGQNGKLDEYKPLVQNRCGKAQKRKQPHKHRKS